MVFGLKIPDLDLVCIGSGGGGAWRVCMAGAWAGGEETGEADDEWQLGAGVMFRGIGAEGSGAAGLLW